MHRYVQNDNWRISIQSGWKVTVTVFLCFVFVTHITHKAKNWHKLSLCRVPLQDTAHGGAIKHVGTCWNDTFHWQSFRRSLHLCLGAVDRRAIYIQPLVFCSWTVCTLIIQEPGEGGNLRLAPPLPVPPSFLYETTRNVAEDLFLCVWQTLFPNKLRLLSWVRSHSPSESSKTPKNRVKSHSKENKQYINILLIKTTQSMEKLYNHFKQTENSL